MNPTRKTVLILVNNPDCCAMSFTRLPTGKVIDDILGWIMHPGETFKKKRIAFAACGGGCCYRRKDKYGTPIVPESAGTLEKIARVAKFIVGTHMPPRPDPDPRDIAGGHGTELDKDKTIGNLTGFTFGQGHPKARKVPSLPRPTSASGRQESVHGRGAPRGQDWRL